MVPNCIRIKSQNAKNKELSPCEFYFYHKENQALNLIDWIWVIQLFRDDFRLRMDR